MNARALLVSVLLVSPAWAQEAAPTSPAPGAFDLSKDSIRRIVRATAATQYAEIRPLNEAAVEHERPLVNEFVTEVRLAETPSLTRAAPTPAPAQDSPSLLSALIDLWLGNDEPDTSPEALYEDWLSCQQHDDLENTSERYETCPGHESKAVYSPAAPSIYTPPTRSPPKN